MLCSEQNQNGMVWPYGKLMNFYSYKSTLAYSIAYANIHQLLCLKSPIKQLITPRAPKIHQKH